jgi:hypothetical protein
MKYARIISLDDVLCCASSDAAGRSGDLIGDRLMVGAKSATSSWNFSFLLGWPGWRPFSQFVIICHATPITQRLKQSP